MEEAGMMNENIKFFKFENSNELVLELADNIAHNLQKEINEKGKASLLVSGGSTPKALFERLSTLEIDWRKVKISLVDERWVSPYDKDSNERLVRESLLINKASKANFISYFVDKKTVFESVDECETILKNELLPFCVVILGMGSDAHTASIFPNNIACGEAFSTKKLCFACTPQTAKHDRMSLSLSAIMSAKNIYLHFEGEEKQQIFEKALEGDNSREMPIRAILNQTTKQIEVYTA